MRLLEFSPTGNSTGLQQAIPVAVQIRDLPKPAARVQPVRGTANPGKSGARVFPIQGNTVRKPLQRGPIDLEKLQERVAVLEKRIRKRTAQTGAVASNGELDQLRQRLKKLEQNINTELWAARQREHTMLEMLARPPLATRIGDRITRIWTHNLPATGQWLKEAAVDWLQDRQPDWWPTLTRAWKESLDKARGIPPTV